jgi:hypothetical protein
MTLNGCSGLLPRTTRTAKRNKSVGSSDFTVSGLEIMLINYHIFYTYLLILHAKQRLKL